jgi:hypothetical protein
MTDGVWLEAETGSSEPAKTDEQPDGVQFCYGYLLTLTHRSERYVSAPIQAPRSPRLR